MKRILVALLAAAALAGCGGARAPDLFVLYRTGSIPGAKLRLLVSDDGFVSCNGGSRRRIPDRQLLAAREIARQLDDEARAHRVLAPGPRSVLSYRLRMESGTVRFSDSSRGQTKEMFLAQSFTRQVAQGVCGLPR